MHFQEIFFDIKFKYSEKAKEILEKLTFYFQIFLNSHNTYLNLIQGRASGMDWTLKPIF